MLIQLSIRDIVLIDTLEISFGPGLSVLSGETGAGKSVLMDSLMLALGARGDAALVRRGAARGEAEAVFDVPPSHPARQLLAENGLEAEGDIILRRVQAADGRSRVFINGKIANLSVMQALGAQLAEIHGQHADRAFADTQTHRAALDAFGGLEPRLAALAELCQTMRRREKALEAARAAIAEAEKTADYLRAAAQELEKLAPQAGEEEELAAKRSSMIKAEKIAGDINEAAELMAGRESPIPVLANLARRLERKAGDAQELTEPVIKALDQALQALSLTQESIDAAMRRLDFDPRELEQAEERLFALRGAARKYSVAVENLPELQAKMSADLQALNAGEEGIKKLEAEAEEARAAYMRAAQALSAARAAAAQKLEREVAAELPALKLEQAKFIVHHEREEEKGGAAGIDNIEFWVQTNPGTKAGPMMKTASGGELSRFLLALKVVLAAKISAPTLVFDEIDTGLGGAVADAIGKRLKRLAQSCQVLAITHAPQIAARADAQFLIQKSAAEADKTETKIHLMSAKERQEEIARMLAGEHITDEARAAAEKLLAAE